MSEDDALFARQVQALAERVLPELERIERRVGSMEASVQTLTQESRACREQWDAVDSARRQKEREREIEAARVEGERKLLERLRAMGKIGEDTMTDELAYLPPPPPWSSVLATWWSTNVTPTHLLVALGMLVGGSATVLAILDRYAPGLLPAITDLP